jgi:23S rRNA (guanine2445-N2)-methyltransferase / 23S rRNA (guanine2069-N7)-methyltransferase
VSNASFQFLASSPRGLADLLGGELISFGATEVRERSADVAFRGSLETAYRACLESRVANRVYLELARYEAQDAQAFYRAAREIDWAAHLGSSATLACDFSGQHPSITHSHFGALKLKDAIVDSLRESTGARPDVARERPSVRVHAHAHGNRITLALDLAGESLHRRGYRGPAGEAPLKENVAAGMLMRAGWPELAAAGGEFLDPMCGSGTLVIEAAMLAADLAPGLARDYFGFLGWGGHDAVLWETLRAAARARINWKPACIIRGQDRDAGAVRSARTNAQHARVEGLVQFEARALADAAPAAAGQSASKAKYRGLLCTNPPYGMRLEDHEVARAIHNELGKVLRERFDGWHVAILTGSPDLGLELGIRAYRTHKMWNGALECRLLRLEVAAEDFREPVSHRGGLRIDANLSQTPGAKMFANRLGKNVKRLRNWAERSDVSCYRLYDADMPEYAFAIDSYQTLPDALVWLYVQEYAAPVTVDAEAARRRRNESLSVLPDVTGVPLERIRVRMRRQQKGSDQYEKMGEEARFHVVEEGGLKFQVNFDDYLDTGLFLDHRLTRARLREAAAGKHFLNLFSYTGTATVHAAAGAAQSTVSVDLSNTYLDWSQRNLALNGFTSRNNALVQADCREWLHEAAHARMRYDLVFLDPPTFSNSKRMAGVLDLRRDHSALIEACMQVLASGGLLLFSTNAQKFRLDEALSARYSIRDISAQTLPVDFERNPRIHRAYEIRDER